MTAAVSGVAALVFIRWDDLADLLASIPQPTGRLQVIRLQARTANDATRLPALVVCGLLGSLALRQLFVLLTVEVDSMWQDDSQSRFCRF